jgi:hypothetical protein
MAAGQHRTWLARHTHYQEAEDFIIYSFKKGQQQLIKCTSD